MKQRSIKSRNGDLPLPGMAASHEEAITTQAQVAPAGPVECLGEVFASDDERRRHFLERFKEYLRTPEFRSAPGFPRGEDKDLLRLADPPYFTPCPNPFLREVVRWAQTARSATTDSRLREPFAMDVSEGKNDPIYNAHSYHTKVPHKAIMHYILHYTAPGDVVLDGFCGTGMTGVACQLCSDRETVAGLGYVVGPSGSVDLDDGTRVSQLGPRIALLNDLSPAATFISSHYNRPKPSTSVAELARRVLAEVESECGWMFETQSTEGRLKGRTIYTIWSEVFVCGECSKEVVFWDAAIDHANGLVRDDFPCPHCGVVLTKRSMVKAWTAVSEPGISDPIRRAKVVPVRITYAVGSRRFDKRPDSADLALVAKIEATPLAHWFPRIPMLSKGTKWGDTWRAGVHTGVTHSHHFFTTRNLAVLSALYARCKDTALEWAVTGIMQRASRQHQIAISRIGGEKAGDGGATAGHRRGTLYIPSNQVEFSPFELFAERVAIIAKAEAAKSWRGRASFTSTGSAVALPLDGESVDYIFTDPPFGGNIMYSELNFIWESLLGVWTNAADEAIQSPAQGKEIAEYQRLMTRCFAEYYRVLRPGRWMTVEFHNSQNAVWVAIQEAIQAAGFVVADVQTLDKKIKTHTQRTGAGSVNQDLAISAYKPTQGLEEKFALRRGTEDGVWEFIRSHLGQLPSFVAKSGLCLVNAERQNYLLFDRMVAFHVQRGVTVPMSSAAFYQGLTQRFIERDGMFFLTDQVAEYDRKRASVTGLEQLALFVSDEASAIQWLRRTLTEKPQTFQDLQPQFMQETRSWSKHEKLLDLRVLLEENFIAYAGNEDVPSQIHAYLSSSFRDLRNLPKSDSTLRARAKDRWYVPDPKKAADLEKLRERALLKEFAEYVGSKQRKLKQFRAEAVRAGFKAAYDAGDYRTILTVAARLPEAVLQEDEKLLMYYDVASMRLGEG